MIEEIEEIEKIEEIEEIGKIGKIEKIGNGYKVWGARLNVDIIHAEII